MRLEIVLIKQGAPPHDASSCLLYTSDALHVEEIEALGKPFDPNFMNAVQQIPAPDGQESEMCIRDRYGSGWCRG